MSNKLYPFYYDRQIEKFIGQFMRIFSGLQYFTGEYDQSNEMITKKIPIVYGTMDRTVAGILNKRESRFSHYKLPLISVAMTTLLPNVEQRRNKYHKDAISTEGKTSDREVMERKIGKPLTMGFELNIIASSQVELFSIVEQILLIFNPRVTINFSSDAWDVDNTSEVALRQTQSEIQYPIGTDKLMVSFGMEFDMPVRLEYPRTVNDKFMDEITKTIYTDTDEEDSVDASGIEESITEADLNG